MGKCARTREGESDGFSTRRANQPSIPSPFPTLIVHPTLNVINTLVYIKKCSLWASGEGLKSSFDPYHSPRPPHQTENTHEAILMKRKRKGSRCNLRQPRACIIHTTTLKVNPRAHGDFRCREYILTPSFYNPSVGRAQPPYSGD